MSFKVRQLNVSSCVSLHKFTLAFSAQNSHLAPSSAPYDRNRGCSQLACEASSSACIALSARLSWMEMATSATRLMAMTVCTMSISQCQGVVFEPSTVRYLIDQSPRNHSLPFAVNHMALGDSSRDKFRLGYCDV